MAADGKLLLRILLLQSLVLGALCCSCAIPPTETQFCIHEYVLKVLVKSRIRDDQIKTHRIKIIKIFKGDATKLKHKSGLNKLLTMPRVCDIVSIKKGHTFLIFGSNVNGDIYTERCSGSMDWKYVSKTVRKNLNKNTYKNGC